MTEVTNNEDVKTQENVDPVEVTESKPQETSDVKPELVEGSKEYNWRKMD